MNTRKRCQQRIRSRRPILTENRERNRAVRALYTFVMLFLIMASLILANLIHQQHGFDTLVSNIQKATEPLQLYRISDWIPFENWFGGKKETITTSVMTHYTQVEGPYYEATNQQVVAIDDGVVLYLDQQESGYLIIIKQDNEILATYGTMSEVHVQENDRILKGQILGLTQDVVYLDFSLQGVSVSFADALAS